MVCKTHSPANVCDFFASEESRPNFLGLCIGDDGLGMKFTTAFSHSEVSSSSSQSPLLMRVMHVIFGCPKHQMLRIAAGRIIAFVKHVHSFGYLSVLKKVCQSMGLDGLLLKRCKSISIVVFAFSPFPTSIRKVIELFPKPRVELHSAESPRSMIWHIHGGNITIL